MRLPRLRRDSRGDRPYSEAEDVRDLLDALGIGHTALIASSYGGRVAVEFAASWPDRVTDLCSTPETSRRPRT